MRRKACHVDLDHGCADPEHFTRGLRGGGPALLQSSLFQEDACPAWPAASPHAGRVEGLEPKPRARERIHNVCRLWPCAIAPGGRNYAGIGRATTRRSAGRLGYRRARSVRKQRESVAYPEREITEGDRIGASLPSKAVKTSRKSPVEMRRKQSTGKSASRLFARRAHSGCIAEAKRIFSPSAPTLRSDISKNAPSLQGLSHAGVARSRRRRMISAVKPD